MGLQRFTCAGVGPPDIRKDFRQTAFISSHAKIRPREPRGNIIGPNRQTRRQGRVRGESDITYRPGRIIGTEINRVDDLPC